MSIVSILFEIGRQIISFINVKKMNVDIIRHLFNVDNKKRNKKKFTFSNMNYNDKIQTSSDILNNACKFSEKNSMRMETQDNTNEELENKNEKILGEIHIFNILKSFICNGNKDKLISLCHDIITKDMSVEIIKERFYKKSSKYFSYSGNRDCCYIGYGKL